MATIYEPPLSAHDLMRSTAEWIARAYRVRVEFTIDSGGGDVATTVIDRRVNAPKEPTPLCNCGLHKRGATTGGWLCPAHGQQL